MIAKCIAILAIVAQISANVCHQSAFLTSNSGLGSQNVLLAPSATISAAPVTASGVSASNQVITKNVVARGKFPVAMTNCGPTPERQIPVTTSHSTAPLQQKPTVRLPASIPAQRTLAHSCTCYKTLLRPRVHDHIVTVPSVERYIETGHAPVVENIHYEAEPVNCGSNLDNRYYFVNGAGQALQSAGLVAAAPAAQAVQSVALISSSPALQMVSGQSCGF